MNKVTLLGRLGSDIEIKNFDNGNKVGSFSLATSQTYKNKGEKVQETQWHNIKCFNKTADVLAQYLKKGDQLLLIGKITYESWEVANEKKFRTVIVLEEFNFIQSSKQTNESSQTQQELQQHDDLPF